ncbi:CBS domain-containing protein [Streptomyces glaucescens]|uniref:CBS domain-containing protein n=1 Tax=Streptomyces glaucescens TaxID=1907 RepID=UPI000A3B292E|nr:CBS domain-containing protein [Streptomyces glaucescens]
MTLVQLQTRSVSAHPLQGTVVDIVCDEDARCVGLVTHAQLTTVRDSCGYTDRIRLSDITDGSGPFVSPSATRAEAEDAMPHGRPGPVPVVDEHGSALGVLTLSR